MEPAASRNWISSPLNGYQGDAAAGSFLPGGKGMVTAVVMRVRKCKNLCGLRVCCEVLFPLISQLLRPGRENSHSLAAVSPAAQGNYIYHPSVVKQFPLNRAVPFFPHTTLNSSYEF